MTRRRWPGRPAGGPSIGKNTDARLMLTPLGAGQSPAIPMQLSGSGSGLILPMAPIWTPPPIIEILPPPPPPPVSDFCVSFSGNANRWLFGYVPKEEITPAKPCSVNICYDPADIIPEDNEFFGVIGNGSIYDFGATGKLPCELNLDGQIIVNNYDAFIYFYDGVPVFVYVGIHEVGDPFFTGEPYYDIAEYCAVQAGVESQVIFIDDHWEIADNEELADFYFVYWDDAGYPCPD